MFSTIVVVSSVKVLAYRNLRFRFSKQRIFILQSCGVMTMCSLVGFRRVYCLHLGIYQPTRLHCHNTDHIVNYKIFVIVKSGIT